MLDTINSQDQDRNCDNEIECRVNFLCDGDFIPVLSREGRSGVCLYHLFIVTLCPLTMESQISVVLASPHDWTPNTLTLSAAWYLSANFMLEQDLLFSLKSILCVRMIWLVRCKNSSLRGESPGWLWPTLTRSQPLTLRGFVYSQCQHVVRGGCVTNNVTEQRKWGHKWSDAALRCGGRGWSRETTDLHRVSWCRKVCRD